MLRIPVLELAGIDNAALSTIARKGESRLQIPVGFLRRQDLGDPIVESGAHLRLGLNDLIIALRIDHERNAHGFHGLVDPRVREYVALMEAMGLTAKLLAPFDEVVDSALSNFQIRSLY